MLIGIPKENLLNEFRVAATPQTIKELIKLGFNVIVEHDAGKLANISNDLYKISGAKIVNTKQIWQSDIIIKINPPDNKEIKFIHEGMILISFIEPTENEFIIQKLSKYKATVISMNIIPRISKAQSFDALSSMANIAGYRAVIEAAYEFDRFFSGQITAAGKILPAKVLVIGAGVAGLSAIGTASNLGAIVSAFDVRREVKEQVESIGGKFLELNLDDKTINNVNNSYDQKICNDFIIAEKKLFDHQSKNSDIIITTVLIPGKPAPKLITKNMIYNMSKGSIIVDLASRNGGNTELTVADKIINTDNGVKIIGYTNLPSRLPNQSSQLYSNNILNLLKLLCKNKDGKILIDFKNEIIKNITIINKGEIIWPKTHIIEKSYSIPKTLKTTKIKQKNQNFNKPIKSLFKYFALIMISILFMFFGNIVPGTFISHFIVLSLSCIVGYYVVWNVSYSLHTPLMSVTNAISGIIMLGAIIQITPNNYLVNFLCFISILITSINIFGGFNITYRMLKMFNKN